MQNIFFISRIPLGNISDCIVYNANDRNIIAMEIYQHHYTGDKQKYVLLYDA